MAFFCERCQTTHSSNTCYVHLRCLQEGASLRAENRRLREALLRLVNTQRTNRDCSCELCETVRQARAALENKGGEIDGA